MGIDLLPKDTTRVFVQRDVRRTPAASATATSGTNSITDASYVVIALDGNLTADRKLTAGEGIDLVDGGANGNITINGELATDSGNKGIATFTASDFDVTAGVVTIDDSGVDHNAIGNTHNMTTDIDARMSPGEGINYVEGLISAETASETNRGIATFDGEDFVVSTGDVTLKATVLKSIDGDTGTATPSVHNIDILGGDGISTVGASNDITITADVTTDIISPIGAVIAWLKSFTNTPSLPSGWVECNGQVLSDGASVYDGQTIPDLNGDNRFLRGNVTSGATGGSATMAHTHAHSHAAAIEFNIADTGSGVHVAGNGDPNQELTDTDLSAASNTENRPPFYTVVWIMRIK